jgi:hypothetical protein
MLYTYSEGTLLASVEGLGQECNPNTRQVGRDSEYRGVILESYLAKENIRGE